jgi:hypothetical protein
MVIQIDVQRLLFFIVSASMSYIRTRIGHVFKRISTVPKHCVDPCKGDGGMEGDGACAYIMGRAKESMTGWEGENVAFFL